MGIAGLAGRRLRRAPNRDTSTGPSAHLTSIYIGLGLSSSPKMIKDNFFLSWVLSAQSKEKGFKLFKWKGGVKLAPSPRRKYTIKSQVFRVGKMA